MEINSYTLLKEFEVVTSGLLFILPVIPLLMLETLPPIAILVAISSYTRLLWSGAKTPHGILSVGLGQTFSLPRIYPTDLAPLWWSTG